MTTLCLNLEFWRNRLHQTSIKFKFIFFNFVVYLYLKCSFFVCQHFFFLLMKNGFRSAHSVNNINENFFHKGIKCFFCECVCVCVFALLKLENWTLSTLSPVNCGFIFVQFKRVCPNKPNCTFTNLIYLIDCNDSLIHQIGIRHTFLLEN